MKTMKLIVVLALSLSSVKGFGQLYTPSGNVGATTINPPNTQAVGIGTSLPIMKLDIQRGDLAFTTDASIDQAYVFLHQYWMTNGSLVLTTWVPSLDPAHQPASKQWVFGKDGTFKCFGKIWAPEIGVKLPPFPDYVFENNYDLMSVGELKDYISQNKHLPGVPTAAEVERDGIGLGELQTKTLEKVEELALYIVDLHTQNEQLRKEIAEIKAYQNTKKSIKR